MISSTIDVQASFQALSPRIAIFSLHSNAMMKEMAFSRGTGRLSDLPKVTQLVHGRVECLP